MQALQNLRENTYILRTLKPALNAMIVFEESYEAALSANQSTSTESNTLMSSIATSQLIQELLKSLQASFNQQLTSMEQIVSKSILNWPCYVWAMTTISVYLSVSNTTS